jgi:hypothetical protein
MNWHVEENKAKLHILISLARSQRALARMIESMSDVATHSRGGLSCEQQARQLRAISAYQRQLSGQIARIRIRKLRRGLPGKPWLHRPLRRTSIP